MGDLSSAVMGSKPVYRMLFSWPLKLTFQVHIQYVLSELGVNYCLLLEEAFFFKMLYNMKFINNCKLCPVLEDADVLSLCIGLVFCLSTVQNTSNK